MEIAGNCYVVRVAEPKDIGFAHTEMIHNLPVTGVIVDVPRGKPGNKGQKVLFQYNVHFEHPIIEGVMAIPFEYFYMIGEYCVNDFVLCKYDGRDKDYRFEDDYIKGQGEVVFCRKNSLFEGKSIIFDPRRAHKIEKEAFNTTTDEKYSLVSLKERDILLYRDTKVIPIRPRRWLGSFFRF